MRPPGENPETSVQSPMDELLHPQRPCGLAQAILVLYLGGDVN
ncbi:MAG: hypothetical protein ACI9SQ_000010 [Rubritalea sp.]|jgi:hypothetical protein